MTQDQAMNQFDYDTYQVVLDQIRDGCISGSIAPQDLLREHILQSEPATLAAIDVQDSTSPDAERKRVDIEVAQGYFPGLAPAKCIGAWLLAIEVQKRIEVQILRTRFAAYQAGQALFGKDPGLLGQARENELLPRTAIKQIFSDGTAALHKGYGRLDPLLAPSIIEALEQAFPGLDLYLRLDPERLQPQRPASLLEEDVQVPARYQWWRNLGLYRGQSTGGRYILNAAVGPKDDVATYKDYHTRGFRALETVTQRRDADHLTMMLEELQTLGEGLMIGRCIHLDTRALHGTAPADAEVLHVDLAINVFTGAKVGERLAAPMHTHEKVAACFRTHLLRAERVPFDVLTMLSQMFFASEVLKADLFADQFSEAVPSP
jgi:hypothetical protein